MPYDQCCCHGYLLLTYRLHVVFGHVVSGQQYVTEMENQKVDANHRPYADVRISNCGELVLMRSMFSSTKLYTLIISCWVASWQ